LSVGIERKREREKKRMIGWRRERNKYRPYWEKMRIK
jgi:hypothetical protein